MTQEEYKKAAADVVYLASCMVNGQTPDAERVEGMDLGQLYGAADRHLLTGIVGYALEAAGVTDYAFTQAKGKAIRKIVLFDVERGAVLAELEKAGIWYMPLKGCVLKDYYPKIGMRQMSDNDILYDVTRREEMCSIMEGLGFTSTGRGNCDDHYAKAPVCNFEMHHSLFSPYTDEAVFAYYRHIRDKMRKDEGSVWGFHLPPEDFYIYMITHEYKHYSGGGTGLRSLLDTYVYLHKASLDMAYVNGEMEKLGIADFEEANRSLALHLFDGEALTESEQEMLEEILSSGTYGTMRNRIQNQIKKKGRWGYFLSRLTLPGSLMHISYPILDRVPALYPLCWTHRLVHAFFFKHKIFLYQLKAALPWNSI